MEELLGPDTNDHTDLIIRVAEDGKTVSPDSFRLFLSPDQLNLVQFFKKV